MTEWLKVPVFSLWCDTTQLNIKLCQMSSEPNSNLSSTGSLPAVRRKPKGGLWLAIPQSLWN